MMQVSDFHRAGHMFWRTIAIGSLLGWLLVMMDDRIAQVVSGKKPDNFLTIEQVYFEGGYFHQQVVPTQNEVIQCRWAASIFDMTGMFICGGSGNGTYKPGAVIRSFEPNDWTGGDCSDLFEGWEYEAKASWESDDMHGEDRTVSTTFTFIYEVAK